MQVDGEAVRLNPCTVRLSSIVIVMVIGYNDYHQVVLSHLNKARILAKRKAGRKLCHSDSEEAVTHVRVLATSLAQYQVTQNLIHSFTEKII